MKAVNEPAHARLDPLAREGKRSGKALIEFLIETVQVVNDLRFHDCDYKVNENGAPKRKFDGKQTN
jgi:hypothetical protein